MFDISKRFVGYFAKKQKNGCTTACIAVRKYFMNIQK